jgi:hypothetical protein
MTIFVRFMGEARPAKSDHSLILAFRFSWFKSLKKSNTHQTISSYMSTKCKFQFIFLKMAINKITGFTEKVINSSQTSFIPGRNIMEGVVMLHRTIHEMNREKMNRVVLKLDFESV